MKKAFKKAKDICYEVLCGLAYFVCIVIGAILGVIFVISTSIFIAPIAALVGERKPDESFSDAYFNVFMDVISLITGEKCCESEETES